MAGREPPSNLEAEASVLGAILLKPSVAHEVMSRLAEEDFFLPAHRNVYEAFVKIVARQQAIDVLTLTAQLKETGYSGLHGDVHSFVLELARGTPTAENVAYYIDIVLGHSRRRRMITLCSEMSARCYGEGDGAPGDDIFADFESTVFRITSERTAATPFPVAVAQVLDNIEARGRSSSELRGVPSGLGQLDTLTDGWQPDHLIVVAGRPGMGKSALAINNFAYHAALDLNVPTLIFSLEMSREEMIERLLAARTRIDGVRLRKGTLSGEEWRSRVYPAASRLREAPLEIDDVGGQTIAQLQAKIRRFRSNDSLFPPRAPDDAEGPQGLVIVDYLQLVRGTGGAKQPREQAVAEITQGLKTVAKSTHLPVIAVAQLNRALEKREDKRPQLSDLRESGAIEQDADIILFIHRGDYYPDEASTAVPGQAELLVRKNRHGELGTCYASWIKEITRFENYAPEPA